MIELLLLLLLGTFACLWIPAPQPRWLLSLGLLAGSGFTAFNLGALSTTGIAWACLLFASGLFYTSERTVWRLTSRILFVGLVLGLGFGLLPGFDAVTLQSAQVLKAGSAEYTLRLRVDKVLAGFALLAFAVPLTREYVGWRRIINVSVVSVGVLAPVVLGIGWFSDFVAYQPQLPAGTFLLTWGVCNFLFVTGVEEGFFRGIIQRGLTARTGAIGAILISATLFGLVHFGGGALYVALATIAGAGYGVAYHLAGQRIEAAMLTHFGVNLLHLLLFTYPSVIHASS